MSEKHQPCGKSGCLNCIPSTTSVMRTPDPILYIGEPLRQTQNPRTAKEVIQNMTEQDRKIIALEATVAQQAQMIEHLRGGPTPLYTSVDMGTAAADGFRDGRKSVGLLLRKGFNTLRSGAGEYKIVMQFSDRDDAWAAYNEIGAITRLAGEE